MGRLARLSRNTGLPASLIAGAGISRYGPQGSPKWLELTKSVKCLPNIHDLLGAGMRLLIALSYVPLRSRIKGLGLETSGLT